MVHITEYLYVIVASDTYLIISRYFLIWTLLNLLHLLKCKNILFLSPCNTANGQISVTIQLSDTNLNPPPPIIYFFYIHLMVRKSNLIKSLNFAFQEKNNQLQPPMQ
jgi:hypothetical protein